MLTLMRNLGVGLCFVLIGCDARPVQGTQSLEGAWQVASARRIDGAGISTPVGVGAGLIIFANDRYSIVWTSDEAGDIHALSQRLRPDVEGDAKAWVISDAERIQRFNSVVVNSGTYEATATRLITRPVVALVSDFIGGTGTHEYKLNGDRLLLTIINLQARDGTQHPAYANGENFEFTLQRVQ